MRLNGNLGFGEHELKPQTRVLSSPARRPRFFWHFSFAAIQSKASPAPARPPATTDRDRRPWYVCLWFKSVFVALNGTESLSVGFIIAFPNHFNSTTRKYPQNGGTRTRRLSGTWTEWVPEKLWFGNGSRHYSWFHPTHPTFPPLLSRE